MKKLKLNLSGANELTRVQQRSINGGSGDVGPCSIYSVEDGQWLSGYSVEDAQWLYNNESSVSGYCCASC